MGLVIIVIAGTCSMTYHHLSRTDSHIYFFPVDIQTDNPPKNITIIHLTETDFITHPVLKIILAEEYASPIREITIAKYPFTIYSMPAVSPDEAAVILDRYFCVVKGGEWRYVEYEGAYYQVSKGQP